MHCSFIIDFQPILTYNRKHSRIAPAAKEVFSIFTKTFSVFQVLARALYWCRTAFSANNSPNWDFHGSMLCLVKWSAFSQWSVARFWGRNGKGNGLPNSFLRTSDIATEKRVTLGSPCSSIESKLSRLEIEYSHYGYACVRTYVQVRYKRRNCRPPPRNKSRKRPLPGFWTLR